MKKKVIWLTGGFSSGKSTQRRIWCNTFADGKPQLNYKNTENGINYQFTRWGIISCIGKVKQLENGDISQCDGLDSVFGFTKKEGGIYSVHKALGRSKLVILEGSQTSPAWAVEMQPILKEHEAELYFINFELSYWDNILRLAKRRDDKGKAGPMGDKAIESVIGKNRQFTNCYDKIEGLCHRLKIDAMQTEEEIFTQSLAFVFGED